MTIVPESGFALHCSDWELFLRSPGFGGVAAVIAATLAFVGVMRTAGFQRVANRKQQWWDRARWALDLTLNGDDHARDVGLAVLEALAQSEYASIHEHRIIAASVDDVLEDYQAQSAAPDDPGTHSAGEAHLSPSGPPSGPDDTEAGTR